MASPVRRRRSPEQWQRLIAHQAESGQSQVEFCAEHGLALKAFQRWRRQLEPSTAPVEALFKPLTESPVASGAAGGWTIELDLGDDVCLRLRRGGM